MFGSLLRTQICLFLTLVILLGYSATAVYGQNRGYGKKEEVVIKKIAIYTAVKGDTPFSVAKKTAALLIISCKEVDRQPFHSLPFWIVMFSFVDCSCSFSVLHLIVRYRNQENGTERVLAESQLVIA